MVALGLCAVAVTLAWLFTRPRSDAFFVRGSRLEHRQWSAIGTLFEPENYPVSGHHILAGDRVVLGYRWFQDPSWDFDDEVYEKITIEMPAPLPVTTKRFATGSASIHATVDGTLASLAGDDECNGLTIKQSAIFQSLPIEAVTPWLGKAAGVVYAETYRR